MKDKLGIIDKKFSELTTKEHDLWEKLESDDEYGAMYSSIGWLNLITKVDKQEMNLVYVGNQDLIVIGLLYYENIEGQNEYYSFKSILAGYNPFFSNSSNDDIKFKDQKTVNIGSKAATSSDVRFIDNIESCDKDIYHFKLLSYLEFKYPDLEIFIGYVSEHSSFQIRNLEMDEYHKHLIGNRYFLDVDFISVKEFMERFSRNRQKNENYYSRKLEKEGFIVALENLSGHIAEHSFLCKMNADKYGFHNFNVDFFNSRSLSLIDNFKNDAKILCIKKEDKIVASMLFIEYKRIIYVDSIGIDYQKIDKSFAPYIQLVFKEIIKVALENKIKGINYGELAHETKLKNGLNFEKVYIFTKQQQLSDYLDRIENDLNQLTKLNRHLKLKSSTKM